MDFTLTEEQRMLQKTVADFAQGEIAPTAREFDAKEELNRALLPKMAKLGLLGVSIPKKYGGSGFDYISLGLACWELERADTPPRVVLSVHVALNSLSLLTWGNEDQKKRYLVPQAKGEKIAAFGLTEPGAGSDVAAMETRAERRGDSYVLNGEKTWVSMADAADNFLIFAYTDKAQKAEGVSAFIVERAFGGITTSPIKGKLGGRTGDVGSIALSNVRVPRENLLGQEGEGMKIALSALDNGRYTVAAGAVGLIQASLEAAARYANQRETFGQKIGRHELVQEMIAEIASDFEVAKLLLYYVGWLKNQGTRCTRQASLAKLVNTEAAFRAAHNALQIHGAYGYSNEFPVERYFRNARGSLIYEGTSQIQKKIQAEYALGYREDRPLRCTLPKFEGSDPNITFPDKGV